MPFGEGLRRSENGARMKDEGGAVAFGFSGEELRGEVSETLRLWCVLPLGAGAEGRGLALLLGGCPGTMDCLAKLFAA